MRNERLDEMNAVEGTFLYDGVRYNRNDLPPHVQSYCATIGLVKLVAQASKPDELYAELKSGTKTMAPRTKTERYSEWHKAASAAHALGVVKAEGVKAKPGKSLRDAPEFDAAYKAALVSMSPWSREKTSAVKNMPHVFEEWRRITDAPSASLDSLFGAPAAAAVTEMASPELDDNAIVEAA